MDFKIFIDTTRNDLQTLYLKSFQSTFAFREFIGPHISHCAYALNLSFLENTFCIFIVFARIQIMAVEFGNMFFYDGRWNWQRVMWINCDGNSSWCSPTNVQCQRYFRCELNNSLVNTIIRTFTIWYFDWLSFITLLMTS